MRKTITAILLSSSVLVITGCTVDSTDSVASQPFGSCNFESAQKLILLDSPCPGIGEGSAFRVSGRVKGNNIKNIVAEFYYDGELLEKFDITPTVISNEFMRFEQPIQLNDSANTYILKAVNEEDGLVDQAQIDLRP